MNQITGAWPELVATALLGTSRRPRQAWPAPGIGVRSGGSAEEQLLDAAALAQAARLAGRCAESGAPAEPAAPDRLAAPGDRAVQLLELILTQTPAGPALRPALLQLWCETAVAAGRRLPHHLLPTIFKLSSTPVDAATLLALQGAMDERGRWLATQFPQVRLRAEESSEPTLDPAVWPTIPTAQRVVLLTELRRHDPTAGRELLLSTWASEPARDRASLLAALAESVSLADEEFLESVLDDRAPSVRVEAARLLDQLPQSRRAARMADRLRPLISRVGLLKKQLKVDAPAEPDASAQRDGITTPKHSAVEYHWLTQLIAASPLTIWEEFGGPAALREISQGAVESGLIEATMNQRDQAWARVLMKRHPQIRLLEILDPDERSNWIEAMLSSGGSVAGFIDSLPGPWDEWTSTAICDAIRRKDQQPGDLVGFARKLHPQVAGDLLNRVDRQKHNWLAIAVYTSYNYHSVRRSIQEAFHD